MLDSTNATEHDDELFCRSCYGKKFGPKGYGYGGGAGVLSMDDGTGYVVSLIWCVYNHTNGRWSAVQTLINIDFLFY